MTEPAVYVATRQMDLNPEKGPSMTLPPTMALDAIPSPILAFGMPSGWEWIALLALGLLVFGRRLPEVGRSVGKSIVEFKKGIKGIEEDIDQESTKAGRASSPELMEDSNQNARHPGLHANESRAKDS